MRVNIKKLFITSMFSIVVCFTSLPERHGQAGSMVFAKDNTTSASGFYNADVVNSVVKRTNKAVSEEQTGNAILKATSFVSADAGANISGGVLLGRAIGSVSSGTGTESGAVSDKDRLGFVLGRGYDGSEWQNSAGITIRVDGTVSSGFVPASVAIETGTNYSDRKERLIVKSDGNVGIGTTDPDNLVEVQKDQNDKTRIVVRNDSTGSSARARFSIYEGTTEHIILNWKPGASEGGVGTESNNPFHIYSNGTSRISVKGSGNVGIATTSPSYTLEVNGTAAGTSWTNLSSREYKDNIKKVDSSRHNEMLANLMKVDINTYNYKKEYGDDHTTKLGFIAEELPEEVLSTDGKGVDLYELLTYTIGAMKAQHAELKAQRVELKAQQEIAKEQEKRIEGLEAKISKL